jgi:hypothetical protein
LPICFPFVANARGVVVSWVEISERASMSQAFGRGRATRDFAA